MLDINNKHIKNDIVFSKEKTGIPLSEFAECLPIYQEILSKEELKQALCKMIDNNSEIVELKYEVVAFN